MELVGTAGSSVIPAVLRDKENDERVKSFVRDTEGNSRGKK